MLNREFGSFAEFDSGYDDAEIVVFGAPFDGTTSFRPGTRFGPEAIRKEFYGLETYSPYLDMDMTDYKFHDGGDVEIPIGNIEKSLENIHGAVSSIVGDDKIPFMVGGEHLVTYPSFKAVWEKYPDVYLIHFDAHADLRDDYLGVKLSHATVIRRCWDLVGDDRIFQFGIRSGDREEFNWAKEHTTMEKFSIDSLSEVVDNLKGKKVYVTIDLDILDPSVFPGTGTPEPGGISFGDMTGAIGKLKGLDIIGMDIVELSPHYDNTGISTAAACKIMRELALAAVSEKFDRKEIEVE
ncbi:agmatinase [Dethiosulfatibacter aminovorans DSM 17477]|uniref:Agmatinase n=1 Tax=Dethiosulfatibacter aminovorans DSM 17477 TaxID=1121476 RepID=A0A1M6KJ32_9FIRM|nr:agmatinase [Dethiosulfatibacter aminovorans]SHJ58899.1 agmatinase [Dethiosulfatibacter aminovorans DSM 17477]